MKLYVTLILVLFSWTLVQAQDVFLNEINYISTNAADRWIEVAGDAGTDIDGWYMTFHEADGTIYHTETVSGSTLIDNEAQGKGGIWMPVADLQDQGDRSIILYDDTNVPKDTVSYGTIANFTGFGASLATPITTLVGAQTSETITAQNGGSTNSSSWTFEPATKGNLNQTQLPVELIAFRATMREKAAILTWETASEENNSHFEIQRSIDGIEFSTIGTVTGAGTTHEEQTYEFTDNIPMNGENYYRLKQVDFQNEGYEFSNIVLIETQNDLVLTIAPNPIEKGSELNIITKERLIFDFTVFDITGRIVKYYPNIDGQNIDLNDLETGTYIYQIRQDNQLIKVDKLVVFD